MIFIKLHHPIVIIIIPNTVFNRNGLT